ncbi:MAG: translation initiation factor IF-1 [Candidatus Yonathbacteria bacterium]|nr:translation initiation factor IF-1 [Candidatus Yonathbacteria bacterium]
MSKDVIQQKEQPVVAVVEESLPNAEFRVILEDDTSKIAYLSGKMRLHRIKVLVGDRVQVVIDPYGGKGRITRRL